MRKKSKGKRALTRSEIMSRIRRRDTKPERALRQALWRLGLRYRVDLKVEGVHVDVAFPPMRMAVFVDGCFWHSCPEHGSRPNSNRSYWHPKLRRNRARDRAQTRALCKANWQVMRIWEHKCLANPMGAALEVREGMAGYGPSPRSKGAGGGSRP